jgi:hypothetical protein
MTNFRKIKESLDWVSHGKLVVELLFMVAGMKAVKGLLMSFTKLPEIWISPIEWASAAIFLGILIAIFNRKPSSGQHVFASAAPLFANSLEGGASRWH